LRRIHLKHGLKLGNDNPSAALRAAHQRHMKKEADGSPRISIAQRDQRGFQMLLNLLRTITDLVVLITRLTVEELTDQQRVALIDQFTHLQGLEAAFHFDLHDLLMILITILMIIFWRAWERANRWPFR
jgi:hypothetical protein